MKGTIERMQNWDKLTSQECEVLKMMLDYAFIAEKKFSELSESKKKITSINTWLEFSKKDEPILESLFKRCLIQRFKNEAQLHYLALKFIKNNPEIIA